jgi:hypothetical protein
MSLSEKLNKAAGVAKTINALTDEANDIISKVNKFLLEHRIGVTKWLCMPMKDNVHYLGVDRVKDQMVLAVRNSPPLRTGAYCPKALAYCDREIRLMAVPQIALLLDVIIEELNRERTVADESREAIIKLRGKLN